MAYHGYQGVGHLTGILRKTSAMKPIPLPSVRQSILATAFALPVLCQSTSASSISWANSGTDFNAPTSWTGGIVPGVLDLATFDSARITDPSLSAPASVRGLVFSAATSSGYAISGSTLTLGSGGINASAVTSGSNTISAPLTLAAGGQVWSAGTGSTLAINPSTFSRLTGSTVTLNTTLGSGTVSTSTITNTNSIVGPWATVQSTGASANNSSAGNTYATVSGGNIVAYTGATASTGTTAWGGAVPSGGTGTINYDLSSAGTLGAFGLARNVNTFRYTGTGARQPGNTENADLLTINGFMNAGTGTFTFGTLGNVTNDRPYNVLIGSTLSLVLDARSADISMLSTIKNNGGGASSVTIAGNNTVTLSRANVYTGATTVAGGTLLINGTGSINTSSGLTINGANARYLHTSSVASTIPVSLLRGTLNGTGSVGAVTVADDPAAILTHGNGGVSALTLASLGFQGDATVNLNHGGTTPIAVTGALSTTPASGQVTINVPNSLPNGLTNLISFGSFTGSATDFTGSFTNLGPRQVAGPIVLNGNNIAASISGESVVWTGATDDLWETLTVGDDSGPNNWARKTAQTATNFWSGDVVEFNDTYNLGAGNVPVVESYVTIDSSVSPNATSFDNSIIPYVIDSFGNGIASGPLTKSGTAATTLIGTHTYTGSTTILAGDLQLGDGSFDGTIANTSSVVNHATLTINANGAQTAAYPISGSGSLVKNGPGNVTLSGTNSSTGNTTINDGTITLAGNGGLGSGSLLIESGAFLNNSKTTTLNQTTTGGGTITNLTGSLVLAGDFSGFTGTVRHSSGTFSTVFNTTNSASEDAAYEITTGTASFQAIIAGILTGTNTYRLGSLSGVVNSQVRNSFSATGTSVFEIGNLGTDTEFAGTFGGGTGTVALTKVGAGTLTLSGPTAYTGPTIINGGTLRLTTSAKSLATSDVTIADGAELAIESVNATTTGLTSANLTLGSSSLEFDFNEQNPTVPQIVTGALTVNGTTAVAVPNSNSLTNGTYKLIDYTSISGTGSFPGSSIPVGNRGTGTIVNNPIDTSIDLVVTTDTPKWTGLDSGEWIEGVTGSNKNWQLAIADTPTDYIEGDTVLFDDSATGATAIDLPFAVVPQSTTFNNSTLAYTLSGAGGIDNGTLTKSGIATTTLLTTNNYTGATTINAGTLAIGDGVTDGSITFTSSVANNGTLAYNLANDQGAAYPISGTGNLTKAGAGNLTLTGVHSYSGGTTLTGGAITLAGNGTLGSGAIALGSGTTLNVNKNLTYSNTFTGSGTIVNTGTGTVTGDFNGFSGTFTHNSPFFSVAFNNANATSASAAYHIASDQGSTQGMIAGGNGDYTLKLGALSGVANSLFRGGNVATGSTTLEIGALATNTEFAGSINNGATKTMALTKVGAGTLTLSGANSYTGATNVNAGAINLTGSITASSLVTVQTGATLTGSGSISGTVVASGTVAPGVGAGPLTTGSVTLTGTLAIEIDGAAGDKLVSTGAINLGAPTLTIDLLPGGFSETSYVIAEGTSITGSFGSIPSGYTVNIVSGGPGQQAILTSTSPSGYATWASANAGSGGPEDDFDLDGVPNGVEYFLNSPAGFTANPQLVDDAITWTNGGNIPASAYGTEFVVQTSTTLGSWTDVPVGELTTNTDGPGGSLTYTLPNGEDKIFVRLSVNPN